MERVEYIKPSIDIVKIYSQTILAGSGFESNTVDPGGESVDGPGAGGVSDGSDMW